MRPLVLFVLLLLLLLLLVPSLILGALLELPALELEPTDRSSIVGGRLFPKDAARGILTYFENLCILWKCVVM